MGAGATSRTSDSKQNRPKRQVTDILDGDPTPHQSCSQNTMTCQIHVYLLWKCSLPSESYRNPSFREAGQKIHVFQLDSQKLRANTESLLINVPETNDVLKQ
jgi:hypothetical protein